MKTQKEYMNSIKARFNEHITANKSKLDAYCYCNNDAIYCFKDFIPVPQRPGDHSSRNPSGKQG